MTPLLTFINQSWLIFDLIFDYIHPLTIKSDACWNNDSNNNDKNLKILGYTPRFLTYNNTVKNRIISDKIYCVIDTIRFGTRIFVSEWDIIREDFNWHEQNNFTVYFPLDSSNIPFRFCVQR